MILGVDFDFQRVLSSSGLWLRLVAETTLMCVANRNMLLIQYSVYNNRKVWHDRLSFEFVERLLPDS